MKINGENDLAKFLQTFCSTFLQLIAPVKLNKLAFSYHRYQYLVWEAYYLLNSIKERDDNGDDEEFFIPNSPSFKRKILKRERGPSMKTNRLKPQIGGSK